MSTLIVADCGPMTSPQDAGRIGSQRFGISRSGAMDRLSLALANTLVGNPPGAGAIEFMLLGGTFALEDGSARVALAGAPAVLTIDGEPVPPLTTATLRAGQSLRVGPASGGVYAYMAIAGGLALEPDLGSVSLQPRAGIGGLGGRALRAGDRLPLRLDAPLDGAELMIATPEPDRASPIRVVLGPQADHFDDEAIEAFLSNAYTVSQEADRMGYRLAGSPIGHLRGFNIVSDGLVSGSVQVPGSGVPIVLMADHQTTGGYPKIATVISADLGVLAQRRPGDPVRFGSVSVEDAQAIARERANFVGSLPGRLIPVRGPMPTVEELLGLNLAGAAQDAFAEP